jgi:polyribonucleotide nucleotidyltransferase
MVRLLFGGNFAGNKRKYMSTARSEAEILGKKYSLESGVLAKQANGSVIVRLGETVVLVTAVMGKTVREGMDYFPLLVDYEERLYAAGKIKGSRFIKREGRATDEAILSGRLIDRSIRPLFPDGMRNDVQVVATILSVDEVNDPDTLAINGASAALCSSIIPFEGPVAAVRVGRINNEFILNPSYEQRKDGDLDLVVAGTRENIMMVEAGAKFVAEEDMVKAIKFSQEYLGQLIDLQKELCGKIQVKKTEVQYVAAQKEIFAELEQLVSIKLSEAMFGTFDKTEREQRIETVRKEAFEEMAGKHPDSADIGKQLMLCFEKLVKKLLRTNILENDRRVDLRPLNATREVNCVVGILPRTHGSALFNRGETQILTTVTLGSSGDAQILDGMEDFQETTKRYMHHYNFPGYSVGEVSPMRGPGRREIGHGALAERAIEPALPEKEKFPYTLRLVSEALGSNGSTSMASTCGSALALMDAGVPISEMIGGVAMGLVMDPESRKFKVLTDIQGIEDQNGDMDFKVTGSERGITALQMDNKTKGLTLEILEQAIMEARKGRLHILDVMKKTISVPREEMSPYAPRITTLQINPERIRDVIGSGGKVINKIIAETGVQIDIEDSGLVMVTSSNAEGSAKAIEWIKNLIREFKPGEVFQGRVSRIMDFGAFVELTPGHEGLVHISELAWYRVGKVEDVVKVGDVIPVKIMEIDQMGRINLSHKIMLDKPEGVPDRSDGGHDRGSGRPFRPRNNSGGDRGRGRSGGPRFSRH